MASHAALRDCFIQQYPNLRYGLGEWRQYKGGVWTPVSDLTVKGMAQDVIPRKQLTSSVVNSVVELARARTQIPDSLFDSNPYIVVFNNCCLNIADQIRVAHAPEYYATAKLEFDYEPGARSDVWENFLHSCPHQDFLQEFAGYCLTPQTKHEIAVWLWGPPGGGKSTFIAGLEAMLGPRSCLLGLHNIERSNFALSQLPGKTLAISTEQPAHFVKSPHIINTIISGESVTVDRKFRDPVTIIPRAKLLWAMNDLPRIDVGGQGMFRRVVPVEWPGLSEDKRDPALKEKIASLGMAVTNWALTGLERLNRRGRFELPAELREAREQYRSQNDVTMNFISDACDLHATLEVASSSLYDSYREWCSANGHRPLASNRFASELQRLGLTKIRRSSGVFWLGLDLKIDFADLKIIDL